MTTDEHQKGAYARVNGLDLYYEIHGSGQPLVLLPGGFMTIEAMGELVPQLAAARRVIGVELQGHGHTADIERPLRFDFMADDIAALIRHPELVRRLVLASTAFKRDGWYSEVLAGMASISVDTFAGTPTYEAYVKTSPRPEAWPIFVAKMRQLLGEDYDWTEAVASLKTHVGWAPPYHGIITRTRLLLPILTEFLDSPLPETS